MAKNLVDGTNIIVEENGNNINMNLSPTYNTNLLETIDNEIINKNVYSTFETRIGTWIDGKPLYRKVLTGTLSNTGTVNFSIQNTKIINYDGFIKSRWGPWYKINDQYVAEQGYEIFSSLNSERTQLSINCGSFYLTTSQYEIVLEYTKTTD